MIHDIGRELEERLRARDVPFKVVDGPEGTKSTTGARERIVIEYDAKAKDVFVPPKSQRPARDGKHVATCRMACKLTIYAQSGVAGAKTFEHRRRARSVADQCVVALHEIATKRENQWTPTGGQFVVEDELAGSDEQPNAVYELTFLFDRGVSARKWDGALPPTWTATKAKSETSVHLAGSADDDPGEIGCGNAEE